MLSSLIFPEFAKKFNIVLKSLFSGSPVQLVLPFDFPLPLKLNASVKYPLRRKKFSTVTTTLLLLLPPIQHVIIKKKYIILKLYH